MAVIYISMGLFMYIPSSLIFFDGHLKTALIISILIACTGYLQTDF